MNGISKPVSREKKYSYEEASARARALDIRSSKEYRRRRKEDLRLPLNPHRCYAKCGWKRWGVFLDTDPYSYKEARKRVQELGIRTSKEYLIRYSEDRRLRSAPDDVYPKEWTCWGDFLKDPEPEEELILEEDLVIEPAPIFVEEAASEILEVIACIPGDIGTDEERAVPITSQVILDVLFVHPVPLDQMPPLAERPYDDGWYGWRRILGCLPK